MNSASRKKERVVATYSYSDPEGKEAFQVVRFDPKDFRVRHRGPDRSWVYRAPPCNFPYHLPELLAASDRLYVFVVEGEKDVETLRKLGFVATCNRGGCGNTKAWAKWGSYFSLLTVVIIPDNDDKGKDHAAAVASYLDPHAVEVVLLELPGLHDKEDVSDWLAREGNTADKLNRLALDKLAQAADLAERTKANEQEIARLDMLARQDAHGLAEPDDLAEGWEPFPLFELPPIAAAFVKAGAKALPCDPALIALPALVAMAGAIGNTRVCLVKSSWLEPCILWAVAVAPPSSRKSAAFKLAKGPLETLDIELAKKAKDDQTAYEEELSAWEFRHRKKGGDTDQVGADRRPPKPEHAKLLIGDITVETAVRELRRQPRGLTLLRDELAGWLASFGRYSATGAGAAEVACWTECYEGGAYRYDRASGDGVSIVVPRCSVSVYGTIQPEVMQRCFPRPFFDSGFAYRFILAAPPKVRGRWTDDTIDAETADNFAALIRELVQLDRHDVLRPDWKPRPVMFDPLAFKRWVAYHDEIEGLIDTSQGDRERLLAKGKALCARLCIVLHAASQVVEGRYDTPIEAGHVESAAAIALWCVRETERVYAMIHREPDQLVLERMQEWIRSRPTPVTARDLYLSNKCAYGSTNGAKIQLDRLVGMGLGQLRDRPTGGRGGRPTVEFCLYGKDYETPKPLNHETGVGGG